VSKESQFQKTALGATAAPVKLLEPAASRGQDLETPVKLVVIEKLALLRECLTACFRTAFGPGVLPFPDVESSVAAMHGAVPCLVVLSIGSRNIGSDTVRRDLGLLRRVAGQPPVVILADAEEPAEIIGALEQGAKGYIPASASLEIAIGALRLVKAGGVYAPASGLIHGSRGGPNDGNGKRTIRELFTERQSEVLAALRRGTSNKIIAFELNMRESTVKVHVRNIMKKFGATNRTEVAYLAQAL
jgi:DNA-binding NarL/FixJ family response regulator